MKRRLCLVGLHRWRRTHLTAHDWFPERMCVRCGRVELRIR